LKVKLEEKSKLVPAFAGMTAKNEAEQSHWIPAFAGMTSKSKHSGET